MPVMVIVALVSVFVVQVQQHASRAQAAADAAARAAAYSTSYTASTRAAAEAAAGRVCRGPVALTLDWTDPDPTALRPGRVVVDLTCEETLGGFSALISDPVRSVSATGVAAVEYWRQT